MLPFHIPTVQQQAGTSNCGVFGIAFALHLALGQSVKELEFDLSPCQISYKKNIASFFYTS